jgi:hypothetical protein
MGDQVLGLNEFDVAVLAAIAYHPPITRDALKYIFSKDISRDLIGRLHAGRLTRTGSRSPRRGAPYIFVTTVQFLVAFGLGTLCDLPDREQLQNACDPGARFRVSRCAVQGWAHDLNVALREDDPIPRQPPPRLDERRRRSKVWNLAWNVVVGSTTRTLNS